MGKTTKINTSRTALRDARHNVWNERSRIAPRETDINRSWYFYAHRLIKNLGLNSGRALDIGCGLGEFMVQLEKIGFEVTGIDGNAHQIEQVQQIGYKAQVVDLESALPFDDASFDLITCLEVIEHIALAENLLKEVTRILSPGGYVVISTPNFSCWQNRIRYLLGRGPVYEGIHLRFFTRSNLEQAMAAARLEITDRASFGPVTGINFLLRLFGSRPKNWIVPKLLEGIFAEHLLYAAKRQR